MIVNKNSNQSQVLKPIVYIMNNGSTEEVRRNREQNKAFSLHA